MSDNYYQPKCLQEAIVATVAYFDMFDFPLTAFEIWKYLWRLKASVGEIDRALSSGTIKELEIKNGFVFLRGRGETIKERMKKFNFTDEKIKKAIKIAKIFRSIPWIRMMAVGNVMGAHNLKNDGDIDLFIVTRTARLWLTRFFAILIIKFLGLRPEKNNTKNKICLSFFVSEDNLQFEKLLVEEDIYFAHWLAGLVVIYDEAGIYEKIIKTNNWLKKFLPNWQSDGSGSQRVGGKRNGFYNYFVDLVVGWQEKLAKNFQTKLMPADVKNNANKNSNIVLSDKIIKTHVNDRREEYRNRWKNKTLQYDKIGL